MVGEIGTWRGRVSPRCFLIGWADVDPEEGPDDVEGEGVEHGQGHVRQDEEGDEHGDEPWS